MEPGVPSCLRKPLSATPFPATARVVSHAGAPSLGCPWVPSLWLGRSHKDATTRRSQSFPDWPEILKTCPRCRSPASRLPGAHTVKQDSPDSRRARRYGCSPARSRFRLAPKSKKGS